MDTQQEVTTWKHFQQSCTGSELLTVWSAVAHHQVGRLTLEVTDDLLSGGHLTGSRRHGSCDADTALSYGPQVRNMSLHHLGDVSLDLSDTG